MVVERRRRRCGPPPAPRASRPRRPSRSGPRPAPAASSSRQWSADDSPWFVRRSRWPRMTHFSRNPRASPPSFARVGAHSTSPSSPGLRWRCRSLESAPNSCRCGSAARRRRPRTRYMSPAPFSSRPAPRSTPSCRYISSCLRSGTACQGACAAEALLCADWRALCQARFGSRASAGVLSRDPLDRRVRSRRGGALTFRSMAQSTALLHGVSVLQRFAASWAADAAQSHVRSPTRSPFAFAAASAALSVVSQPLPALRRHLHVEKDTEFTKRSHSGAMLCGLSPP